MNTMNNEWIAVKDPVSGKTYYANKKTRATQWDMPLEYNGNPQPQLIYNQQSQLNMYQFQNKFDDNKQSEHCNANNDASKWKKAHDPSTGNDYWYNTETKETTWNIPNILNNSVVQFDTIWGSDSDDNDNEWEEDDDNDNEYSSSNELEIYNPNKQIQKILPHSLVEDDTSSDNNNENINEKKDYFIFDEKDEILINNTPN
eukprot:235076_1